MPPDPRSSSTASSFTSTLPLGMFAPAMEYMVDAAQRSVLFWDVMRRRSDQYREHIAKTAPHVLDYDVELVVDGRKLGRPVNYCLARVIPPPGIELDPGRRPFIIVDPRAGHGPGIGGFKADSEIGVAFKAGHPCYFVGFLPDPMPGQTIEDVARAEAVFLEKVIALHPEADGKPCVVGNCQAGWAIMMLAAMRPELFGPIIIAGSPLSYWAGVHGKNPMRYSGGLLGGSWLTAFASDLGHGKFDGAWLVQNFENQNPANTLWTKPYNLYAKIDTEAPRYLGFERWWGGHVNLNAEEIQFIVDELFVGNNLAAGKIQTSDGAAIDLRNIRSPIVVFCSKGDNITPPQQALDWILDLYDDVDEMRSYGQTIVYTVHESVGHLGIFVSGGVARKEHGEFSSNIDLAIAIIQFLWDSWRPHSAVLGRAQGVKGYHDITRYPDARRIAGLVLFRWDAPLFFANAELFKERVLDAVAKSPTPVRWLVVAAEPVTGVDVTAGDTVAELDHALQAMGVELCFAELKDPVKDKLKRSGLFAQLGENVFFPTIDEAVSRYLEIHDVDWVDWEDQS
jgi:anti-anti-sigma regulatory factor